MSYVEQLLEGNRRWSEGVSQETPDFFSAGAKGQSPEALWIGCSDSRLPESRLLDLPPGQLFVHRNIANQVIPSDINCLSVIQYAVEFLKVKHIIVCGHHGCGGVAATFDGQSHGLVDNWLGWKPM